MLAKYRTSQRGIYPKNIGSLRRARCLRRTLIRTGEIQAACYVLRDGRKGADGGVGRMNIHVGKDGTVKNVDFK